MIPQGFIPELLSRVDIVEVVGRHVELKKAGVNHKGLCPFHGEKTPSFIVSPSRQTYHCFGCGAHGDALRFLVDQCGLGFVDAVHELAQQVGLNVPDDPRSEDERAESAKRKARQASLSELLARASDYYRKQLKASPRAIDYLKHRGVSGTVAARFALGYAPEGWRSLASAFPRYDDPALVECGLVIEQGEDEADRKHYDRFRDRVMFPIRSLQGEVIGFGGRVLDGGEPKYLNSPETPVFVKGRELYGLYEARPAIRERGYVLVVEGYMDVVALAQLGFANAVATLGTACTEDHVRKLFRFTDSVVFSFDGDAAGRRAAGRALEACLPHATDLRSIRFLFLPAEHDPDSYVRSEGAQAFERCVQEAVPLSRQLLDMAKEGCDLGTPEGRARFLHQARPLWSALPDGALRRQMLAEIARHAALGADELAADWKAQPAARAPEPRRAAPPPAPSSGGGRSRLPPRRPEDLAVSLLLSMPAWWDVLGPEDRDLLHSLAPPHGPLVTWLERELAEHGPRPWAVVRAALEADGEAAAAYAALPRKNAAADDVSFCDLRSTLDTLLLRHLQEQMRELVERMPADPAARELYRALYERCRRLRSPGLGESPRL